MKEKVKCEKCGASSWKTVTKGKKWQCRECGYIKEIENENN